MYIKFSEFISIYGEPENGRKLYNPKKEYIGTYSGFTYDKINKYEVPKLNNGNGQPYHVAPWRTYIRL